MSTRNTRPWLLMCALLAACLAWLPSPSQAQGRGAQQRSYTPPPPTCTAPRATYNNTPQQRSYSSSTSSTYRSSPSQQYLSGSNRSYGMGTNRSYGTGSPNLFNQRGRVANVRAGKSLLPAGVIRVDGQFARGDAVVVRGPDTHEIGRGLVAYDAENAEKIKGRSSPDVMAILGISGRSEMIHRDDLVIGPAGAIPAR